MDSVMINQLPELAIPTLPNNRMPNHISNMTVATTVTEKRNPYITKWYVLFDNRNDQWISFQPQVGCIVYPCYACKDMFGSRSSFLDHVNRRGLVLKYICGDCRTQLTFYNTCSFLLHVRDHFTDSGGSLDLENVDISTIPMEIAGFIPIPNVIRLYDTKDDTINENLHLCTKFYKPIEDCVGKRHVYFKSNDLVFLCSSSNNNNNNNLDRAIQENHALVLCQVNKSIPKCLFVPMPREISLSKNKPANSEHDTSSDNLPASDEESDIICLDDDSMLRGKNNEITPKISCKHLNQLVDQQFSRKRTRSESPKPLYKCTECKKTTNYIKDHFLGDNKPIDDAHRCKRCSLVLPTTCSFTAHCRMHDKVAPFICPECGSNFKNWMDLYKHVEKQCFHLSKSVRWKCPARKCGKVFAQMATFTSHFPLAHMKIRFGCNNCSEYFASEGEYEQHTNVHDHSSVDPCKKIHECTVCTAPINDIKYHVMTHIQDKENRTYVFICKYCRSYYRSTLTYAAHLLRCAKLLLNSQVKKEVEQIESHNDMKCKVIKFCRPCSSKIQFHCTYKDITTVAASCPQCQTPFANDITSRTKFIQHEYTNNCFVQRNIDNSTFECILCDKTLTDEERMVYDKHKCKYKNPVVTIDSSNFSIEDYNLPDLSSSSPSSDEPNKKKRKRFFIKKKTSTVVDKSIDDLSVTPVTFDGEYRCQLCSFTTESRPLFHDHIQEHRDVSTAYQCMECGECFVVKPSLHKHLQVFHSVENVEAYLKENECYDKEAVRLLEETMRMVPGEMSEPVEENQCKICRQMFPDNAELSKHFRTHGMAFLLKKIIK